MDLRNYRFKISDFVVSNNFGKFSEEILYIVPNLPASRVSKLYL